MKIQNRKRNKPTSDSQNFLCVSVGLHLLGSKIRSCLCTHCPPQMQDKVLWKLSVLERQGGVFFLGPRAGWRRPLEARAYCPALCLPLGGWTGLGSVQLQAEGTTGNHDYQCSGLCSCSQTAWTCQERWGGGGERGRKKKTGSEVGEETLEKTAALERPPPESVL